MVVYEATNKKHYAKIASFLKKQPLNSSVLKCWSRGLTSEWIESMKKADNFLEIYVVEDEQSNIRLVWGWEKRGFSSLNEPKIATNAFMCMDNEDFSKGDYTYLTELTHFLIEYCRAQGIVGIEVYGLEILAKFVKEKFYGDAMKINRIVVSPEVGKIYFVYIDIAKVVL